MTSGDNDDKLPIKAPCGCVFGTVDDVFVIEPCSETCEVYAYAVTESRKRQNVTAQIDMRGGRLTSRPTCPACGQLADGYNGKVGTRPKSGAVAVCVGCGEFGIYTDDGIRQPTPIELVEIKGDVTAMALQKLAKAAVARRG